MLAIIIGSYVQSIPVNRFLSSKKSVHTSRTQSKWCLLFEITQTLFLTNLNVILNITVAYTSILSQLTYAITEAEKDVNSGNTFNISEKWLNQSISGEVSNSVYGNVWKSQVHFT